MTDMQTPEGSGGLGGGAGAFVALLVIVVVVVAAVYLGGQMLAENTRAQAERDVARAQAYAERRAADSAAADARHERFTELLPWGFGAIGAIVLLGFGVFAAWDLRGLREREMMRILDADRREVERLRLEVERERLWLRREEAGRALLVDGRPRREVMVVDGRVR